MEKKEPIVINILGGPGVGKTIITSDLFSAIKRKFISCDVSREVIKDFLYEQSLKAIKDQLKIFTDQYFQLEVKKEDVDVVITDSPLIFCAIYDKDKCPFLKALILDRFNKCNNLNYHLLRDENIPYETQGRYQDIEGAKKVDDDVLKFLLEEKIPFKTVYGVGPDTLQIILHDVLEKLGKNVSN